MSDDGERERVEAQILELLCSRIREPFRKALIEYVEKGQSVIDMREILGEEGHEQEEE